MRAAQDRRPARGDATDDERTRVRDALAEQPKRQPRRARRVPARGSIAGQMQGRKGGDVPAAVVAGGRAARAFYKQERVRRARQPHGCVS